MTYIQTGYDMHDNVYEKFNINRLNKGYYFWIMTRFSASNKVGTPYLIKRLYYDKIKSSSARVVLILRVNVQISLHH